MFRGRVQPNKTRKNEAKKNLKRKFPGGSKTTHQAGPEVANFSQIQMGDRVKAVVTEKAAVFIGTGAPPRASMGAGVALAPQGAMPVGVGKQVGLGRVLLGTDLTVRVSEELALSVEKP